MAGITDHYGLTSLEAGDGFSLNGYKFTSADRRLIDNILYLGAEGHTHTGVTGSIVEPTLPPSLSLSLTGGTIPAGTRVYYKYTYVNSRGEESKGSTEAFVDTPAAVTEPGAATLSRASTGGTLQGGNYYYVLTAYVSSDISETRAVNPSYITVPVETQTNTVTLTFPSLPSGATGFNIYRRKPGQTKYFWLTSVNMTIATPPTTYIDTGAVLEDCDRTIPVRNTTNGTNSVTISQPGATPAVPVGYSWKLYRTYVNSDYQNSLLAWVVEYISELSTVVTPTYLDVGASTQGGSPPSTSMSIGSPSKILLTNFAEIQGIIPASASFFTFPVTFDFSGLVAVTQGTQTWRCPFPSAEIAWCEAYLGRGSAPVATAVKVDVNKAAAAANPTYSTIFTTQANRPEVAVGNQVGTKMTPDVTTLSRGDLLTVDIDQAGGGATPADRDLSVTIYLIPHGFPVTSYTPGSSGGAGGSY